jgi:phage-related protein
MRTEGDKILVWMHGVVRTPPFSSLARVEAGVLLRRLQRGDLLAMPHSRPMPSIAPSCHELRIPDRNVSWRIVYFVDHDAIVILDVFAKKTRATPDGVIDTCRQRLKSYQRARKSR